MLYLEKTNPSYTRLGFELTTPAILEQMSKIAGVIVSNNNNHNNNNNNLMYNAPILAQLFRGA